MTTPPANPNAYENELSRARAAAALAAWLDREGASGPLDLRDSIADLIADLGHLWEIIPEEYLLESTFRELALRSARAYEEQSSGLL